MSKAKCTRAPRAIPTPTRRDQTWSGSVAKTFSTVSTKYSVLSTQNGFRVATSKLLLLLLAIATPDLHPVHSAEPTPYPTRLAALAAKCDELNLKEQADITRAWIIPRPPGRQYLFLPATNDPTVPKPAAPEAARQWHRKFLELRRERAAELFQEAKQASQNKEPAKAYQLLHEILREDEDHAEARRILGYVKTGIEWKLPGAEKATPRQPPFNHPKTGWRARGWWSLETTHFQITSNDVGELREASQQLEKLDALWRQIFFNYWSSAEALTARLAGRDESLAPDRPRMQVILFKTQQEYAAYVASSHPKAATTLGIYDDKQHIAYFFGGNKSVYPTWYHEAAHQLFQESKAGTRDQSGQEANYWPLEGVALYMESLTEHAGYWTVGGCESDRLQFARYRVLSGDLNLPLARINTLTRDEIQKSDDIGRIYTQAAGLGHFFIDGEQGQYRDAFMNLIAGQYRGEETGQLLTTTTGQPLPKLDEQYRAFLNVTDAELAGIPDPTRLKNLSLCRTKVTDAGLARFAGTKNLLWLDLSLTATTDAGLKNFSANIGLKQLFLERSQITAAALPLIASFKQLEELDLSQLPISDENLSALAPLRNLKILYDKSGTRLTPEGLRKLRTAK